MERDLGLYVFVHDVAAPKSHAETPLDARANHWALSITPGAAQ